MNLHGFTHGHGVRYIDRFGKLLVLKAPGA